MSYTPFCTDEDIAVRLPGDYVALCPEWQTLAEGTDGGITAGTWVLNSTAINFATNGVAAGNVIQITSTGGRFKGTGELFAVVSVSGTAATIRRVGLAATTGQVPAVATLTNLVFTTRTYYPQIQEATDDLRRRFGIDDNFALSAQSNLYDAREFRQACVLTVLQRQLQTMVRTDQGDWALKLKGVRDELSETMARIDAKWGALGQDQPSTNRIGRRLSR